MYSELVKVLSLYYRIKGKIYFLYKLPFIQKLFYLKNPNAYIYSR